jgi:hypothetical protein
MILHFFTIINLFFVLFHSSVYKHINLLFTSLLVSVFGFLFLNICPAKLEFNLFGNTFEITGLSVKLLDLIFHHAVTAFILYKYLPYYRQHPFDIALLNALLIVLIYATHVSMIFKTYGCKNMQLLGLCSVIFVAIYLILVLS